MEGIIGHESVVALFDRLIQNGQLSHAYCFTGPDHIGKYTLASEVAAQYLKIGRSQLDLHPDVYQLSPEEKENGKIKIEMVRACKDFLGRTSVHGHGLVVLIKDAHTLTDEAANALLKSIEEPPQKTLFLLVTPFSRLLPKTIQSRCQTVVCNAMSRVDLEKVLKDRGVDNVGELLSISDGRVGIAISCVESSDVFENVKLIQVEGKTLRESPIYEKIQTVNNVVGDEITSLNRRVDEWCVCDMNNLRSQVLSTGILDPHFAKHVCKYPDLIQTLRSNVNKQMALEQFLF